MFFEVWISGLVAGVLGVGIGISIHLAHIRATVESIRAQLAREEFLRERERR